MKKIVIGLIFVLFASGCRKTPPDQELPESGEFSNGLVVMNEGLFQQNNASLSFYRGSDEAVFLNAFEAVNGRGLGDTANDMISFSYGGEDYILVAVDVSSQLEIIKQRTLESVMQIPVFDGELPRQPRRVVVSPYFAFICNFDGTVNVLNLSDFEWITTINVGQNPDGIYLKDESLYVTNSGGLNAPNYDSVLTVIDATNLVKITDVPIGINSGRIRGDEEGDLYIHSRGNYMDIPSTLRVYRNDLTLKTVVDQDINAFDIDGSLLYYHDTQEQSIYRYNCIAEQKEDIPLIDCANHQTLYKIQINPINGDVYTFDARGYVNSSKIRCYNNQGEFKFEFEAGLNASKIVFNE
jgi:hypothetical protein